MKRNNIQAIVLGIFALVLGVRVGFAQQHAPHSVLSQHTWYKLTVAEEGVYKLDYATLSAMNIDMERLNPNQIRIFGNVSGSLPEANNEARLDDLTELAIYVSGADDGAFDAEDYVLFYGQEPTCWLMKSNSGKIYERQRNYYTDSTYYYLCVDSGENGLRIGSQTTLPVEGATTVITQFPDFTWHEEELFSPFSIGQNWFGEMLNTQDSVLNLFFCLTDHVKDKPIYVKTELMGRSKNTALHYDLWVNDNILANNGSVAALNNSDYLYGKTTTVDKQILSETDSLAFMLRLYSNPNNPLLFLDYVEMFYWRHLKCSGAAFPFRLVPSQFGVGVSAIWVQNVSHSCQLWEVTNPLRPTLQEGILSANNFVFATNERSERRYFMFRPEGVRSIESWTTVPNQDLHAVTDADMLIITAPEFWAQACDLAQFHQEMDGMTSVVVNVKEIYNEFSTGIPDPSGIRDFVRMVYRRSGERLKYLTLFGRASFDFRNLLGYNRNFVPCYETRKDSQDMMSFCTDDFFGMMDEGEGLNSGGRVDLGIGRLPVASVEEADAAVRKIRHYHDLSTTFGDWRTDHLFLAGDHDNHQFAKAIEDHCVRIIDTAQHSMNKVKIYADAYPTVSTPSGKEKPQAHDDLMRAFEEGFLVMAYSGHGGVKGLTGMKVFSVADFPNLRNADRLPFLFTATCEFCKYDDPLLVSAGEQLFLLPNSGAAALLTSCRPTQTGPNQILTRAFSKKVYLRDEEGRPLRFGDIMRMVKCDSANYSNSTVNAQNKSMPYLLVGDPALRLALPQESIATLRINGQEANAGTTNLHAMSMVSLEGEIQTVDGRPDTGFNGKLWLRLFDKQSKIIPLDDPNTVYRQFKDIVYQGYVSVKSGKFTAYFQVPSDIKSGTDVCRISYYAYDSIRGIDAQGVYEKFTLGGIDAAAIPDDEGPQINFYWNSPAFQNGDVAERQGTLFADLYDAQGIYHYDFSIGRDITLSSNFPACDNLILNEQYEPALDDFRRGRIVIPVKGLTEGTYTFDLKVWDMQNNSSTAHLWFVVGSDLFLAGVRNYPNPFNEETRITMTHVGDDGKFHVNMEVFDLMGRNVMTVSEDVTSADGQIAPLRWDGCDRRGNPLPTGVYLYRLTLTDEQGKSRTVSQRMMIAR